MSIPTIKQRLADGELVRVMFTGPLASPRLVEILGMYSDLHGVWFDQEHAGLGHQELEVLLMASRAAGLDAFVRVAPTDYSAMMRPMELGASGIMVPQVRDVAQVAEAAQWAKYPPLGVRGLYRGNYEGRYGQTGAVEHIEQSNRDRWLCIQIETAEAVDCADEIAAVSGVDCLFVGPGDLACTLGVPGQPMHKKCIGALEKVSAAAKASGRSWGILPANAEHAETSKQLGCRLFSFSADTDVVCRGIKSVKDTFADFF